VEEKAFWAAKKPTPEEAEKDIKNRIHATPLYISSTHAPEDCEYSLNTDSDDSTFINPASTTEPIPIKTVSTPLYIASSHTARAPEDCEYSLDTDSVDSTSSKPASTTELSST